MKRLCHILPTEGSIYIAHNFVPVVMCSQRRPDIELDSILRLTVEVPTDETTDWLTDELRARSIHKEFRDEKLLDGTTVNDLWKKHILVENDSNVMEVMKRFIDGLPSKEQNYLFCVGEVNVPSLVWGSDSD